MELTQELLKEWVHYNPETGIFTWKKHIKPYKVGKEIESLGDDYLQIHFPPTKKYYKLHRLAWFYMYGRWPELTIDHINRDRKDNRLQNLRDVSATINNHNCKLRETNTSGFRGVNIIKNKKKPFRAAISINGKIRFLGNFATAIEASEVYETAKQKFLSGELYVGQQ